MASILIVEDEVAINDLIRAELEAEGHVVRQVFTPVPTQKCTTEMHRGEELP